MSWGRGEAVHKSRTNIYTNTSKILFCHCLAFPSKAFVPTDNNHDVIKSTQYFELSYLAIIVRAGARREGTVPPESGQLATTGINMQILLQTENANSAQPKKGTGLLALGALVLDL